MDILVREMAIIGEIPWNFKIPDHFLVETFSFLLDFFLFFLLLFLSLLLLFSFLLDVFAFLGADDLFASLVLLSSCFLPLVSPFLLSFFLLPLLFLLSDSASSSPDPSGLP